MALHIGRNLNVWLTTLVAAFLTCSALAGDTSHWDEGTVVTFDLERGRVTDTLPFDVSFYLLAKVDEGTKVVRAYQDTPVTAGCRDQCEKRKTLSPHLVKIARPGSNPVEKELFMEVSIDPLDPRTNYSFTFEVERKRNETERSRIVAEFIDLLDKAYAQMSSDALATMAADLDFRRAIKRTIEKVVAPEQVVPLRDSYLDLTSNEQRLEGRMKFADPLQAQMQAAEALDDYRKRVPDESLTLQSNARLQKVKETLQAAVAAAQAADEKGRAAWKVPIELLVEASELLQLRQDRIERAAAELESTLSETYTVLGSSTASYEARFAWYVSADLGLAAVPETDEVSSYIGANIYLRPVNKKAPIRKFSQRFALMVGLTVDKLSDPDRKGLVSDRPILLGAGIRITEHLRLGIGAEIFKEDDPDPLVSEDSLAVSPFVSFSIDWDVAQQFKNIFSSLK